MRKGISASAQCCCRTLTVDGSRRETMSIGVQSWHLVDRVGGESERLRRDAEQARGVGQIEPWFDTVGSWAEHRDLVMRPECGDALPGPSVAMTGQQTVSIQDAGNQIVGG